MLLHPEYVYSRFLRIILPLCLATFLGTIAVYEYYNFSRESLALDDKLDKLARTYALLYAEPVAQGDLDRLQAFTVSLISDPDISRVTIRDADGNVLEQFATEKLPEHMIGKTMRINYASESSYGHVGDLILVISKERLYANLKDRLLGELLLLTILLAVVFLSTSFAFRNSVDQSLKTLSHQANHDSLTGLINRRAFEQVLERTIHNRRGNSNQHVLMYIDLDHFKSVNDRDGHQAGDVALRRVSDITQYCIRDGDFLARIGGDEFAILLSNCDLENAREIGEKICAEIRREYLDDADDGEPLGASIGITPLDDTKLDVQAYLERADSACYSAKRGGRNRVEAKLAEPPLRGVSMSGSTS